MSYARSVPSLVRDDRGDPELFAAVAHDWIAQVEASPAFMIPMTRHQALRFSFGVDDIG
jgi:hypothetical protein